jgi:hypothetical protein
MKMPYYLPKTGVWNPLADYPRNELCYCTSGKKFKKCCLPRVSPTCSSEKAEKYLKIVQRVKEVGAERTFKKYIDQATEPAAEQKDPYFQGAGE